MGLERPKEVEEISQPEAPDDVARLFSWANLGDTKYRDFSAFRREYRAQMRHRAAEERREAEASAKAAAEAAAAEAERSAREAERAAEFHAGQARRAAERHRPSDLEVEQAARERALAHAEQLSRLAAAERMEAARRAEALRAAEQAARREALEVMEAHASVLRQAERDRRDEFYRPVRARERQPGTEPGRQEYLDPQPASAPNRVPQVRPEGEQRMLPDGFHQHRDARSGLSLPDAAGGAGRKGAVPQTTVDAFRGGAGTPSRLYYESETTETVGAVEEYARFLQDGERLPGTEAEPVDQTKELFRRRRPLGVRRSRKALEVEADVEYAGEAPVPSWIEGSSVHAQGVDEEEEDPVSPAADTLQQSRERVASRWFALKGVFDPSTPEMEPTESRAREAAGSMLAMFSIAGGVGKTSLTASLARALAAQGERVLVVDTTLHGLLPYYFGATDLRPGVIRTFAPPVGSMDEPIHLISYDLMEVSGQPAAEVLAQNLARDSNGFRRVLVDVGSSASAVLERVVGMGASVLVPVTPDMNSVISLGAAERMFGRMADVAGKNVEPRFVLSQFDPSLPLQLDVREVMREQLGERLLPFAIRHSPAVAEALAEGMTVIDYAPQEGIAKDYVQLAAWVRTLTASPKERARLARWRER